MGLFGNTSTNTFGGTSLFGQQQQPQQQSTFGQTGGSLFGGMVTGGGFLGGSQTTGTTIKFVPVVSSEQMVKGGVTTNINTKLQCITAMKEYESKSLEVFFRSCFSFQIDCYPKNHSFLKGIEVRRLWSK